MKKKGTFKRMGRKMKRVVKKVADAFKRMVKSVAPVGKRELISCWNVVIGYANWVMEIMNRIWPRMTPPLADACLEERVLYIAEDIIYTICTVVGTITYLCILAYLIFPW